MKKTSLIQKSVTVGIIFLFIETCIVPLSGDDIEKPSSPTSRGNWLYVGGSGSGNYSTIQDAIDNATAGDTVFVYSGTYHEHITIPWTINLIGENQESTIIEGNESVRVVNVTADYVNITGFTIQDGGAGGILIEALYAHIAGNIITNNYYGIGFDFPYRFVNNISKDSFILSSRNRTTSYHNDFHVVECNTISNNELGIITFPTSCNNTLTFNAFLYNRIGVMIGSSNNSLMNNTFVHCGLYVFNDTYSNTVVNNTVNGKILYFLEGQSNKVVPDGIGQLILLRCHNITMSGQELTNTSYGIELIETTHCYISQNIISFNIASGIQLSNACFNVITDNKISRNADDGIDIHGDNNTIVGNTITFNTHDGLDLFYSHHNTIAQNNISNNDCGINFVYVGNYNFVSRNVVQSNEDCGIKIYGGTHNVLEQNDIISNTMDGIDMTGCEQTIIQNNTISHHCNGIRLTASSNNYLMGNTITENSWNGIDLYFVCNFNVISGNNLFSNNSCGIHIIRSNSNTISDNNFINNPGEGISSIDSYKNIISDNRISWDHPSSNFETGIELRFSTHTTITDNTIINAVRGLELTEKSTNNTLLRNTISHSFFAAIWLHSLSANNLINDNLLVENTVGISLHNSNETLIMDNTITRSTEAGVNIDRSSHTFINKNTISQNTDGISLDYLTADTYLTNNIIEENLRAGILMQLNAAHNTISENLVRNNTLGINISGESNSIHHNMIFNNSLGIFIWECNDNSICCNTFSANDKHSGFRVYFTERHNTWNNNYWDHPRPLPYLIVGKIWLRYPITIPWFNVDWHPVQEPFEI